MGLPGPRDFRAFARATAVLAPVLLAACTVTSGQQFSAESAGQIRAGVTDKATVVRYLGDPYQRAITPSGDETWNYIYAKVTSTPTAAALIPLVGAYLPDSEKATNDSRLVTITFHGDVVSSCRLIITSSKASGMFLGGSATAAAAAGIGSQTTRETNCGDTAQ